MNAQNESQVKPICDSGDRFDENLCQTILNYLNLTDKVMFECVCKKWQKLIYKNQRQLRINFHEEEYDTLNQLQEPLELVDFNSGSANEFRLRSVNKQALRMIVKKCTNIEEIYFWCYTDEEIMTILQDCHNLKILRIPLYGLNKKGLIEYGKNCGHKIEIFDLYCTMYHGKNFINKILPFYPNVKEIFVDNIMQLICPDENVLPKLEKLFSIEIDKDNYKICEIISKKYSDTLKSLTIYLDNIAEALLPFDSWKHVMNHIIKLKRLECLDIYFGFNFESKRSIDNYLIEMSNNCQNMKELIVRLRGNWDHNSLLATFARFESLTRLDIDIKTGPNFKTEISCLKCCKKLKYFKLYTEAEDFDESFLNGIDSLTSLTDLNLSVTSELSDRTIVSIAGLKNLKKLFLTDINLKYMKSITDESVCQLLIQCPLINFISFASNPNITNKTIETLISCAIKRPKIRLRIECDIAEDVEGLNIINMDQYVNEIPQNLTIGGTFFA